MSPENTGATLAAVAPIAAKGDAIRLDTDIGSIVGYIVVGMVVGLLARLLVPGRDPIGLLGTLVIGVAGAVLGGWLAGAFLRETEGVDWLPRSALPCCDLARPLGVQPPGLEVTAARSSVTVGTLRAMAPAKIRTYVETGTKRAFAGAIEWPGWCRAGRDPDSALEALFEYRTRYAKTLRGTRLGFEPPVGPAAFVVVERLKGDATTDFGASIADGG
jgi:uncharacterized membrane protein YeaQ/YmgE (transglycosylase-associated protein family)